MGTRRFPAALLATAAASGVLLFTALGDDDSAPELARLSLTGADTGSALFAARQLVPGQAVSNCLPIVNGNTADRGDVRLAAADLTGALVPGLRIRVELGTGGTRGDCTGFTGATVFDGPLSGLAVGGTGISTGWTPAAGETRTYRLTVQVADDNALQHTSAGATLTWLRDSRPAVPTPTGPQPTTPATTTPTGEAEGRQDQASVRRTQAPGVFDAASSSGGSGSNPARPGSGSTGATGAADDFWPSAADAVADAIDVALKLVGATAKHPWYLVGSVGLMWLFLFAADRSEKSKRGPYLRFPPDSEDDDRALD